MPEPAATTPPATTPPAGGGGAPAQDVYEYLNSIFIAFTYGYASTLSVTPDQAHKLLSAVRIYGEDVVVNALVDRLGQEKTEAIFAKAGDILQSEQTQQDPPPADPPPPGDNPPVRPDRHRRGLSGSAPATAQGANGQPQDGGMAEHHAEEAADRKYSINEQISGIESQISELRAKLTEAGKNHEAEARQIAAEREKIASSIQQLEYSKQKLIDLQNRIAGKKDECDSLAARYANDIANWTWLSKNDVLAELQKSWDEVIFMIIKSMNDMARAITGNGGQGILPSAPSSRAMAPAQPTDGLLQQEKGSLNDLQGAEKEQRTAINAQDAQNGSALGQINREEANRQHQYELSRQSLQEQVHRSEERLADLNQKLANVGINAAAGAAAAGGVSS